MPDYAYKAADETGAVIKGSRFANSEEELIATIRATGLQLLEFQEAKTANILKALQGFQIGGIRRRDLIDFSNSMGVMFRAGVPLVNALDELRQDVDSKTLRKILAEIIEDIQAGETLTAAMAKRPKAFPPLYTNVVQIGESTGGLDTIFFDLARHYKRIDDLIRNVRRAMMYPIFVVLALSLAGYVFLTKVFPALFQLLKDFNVPLPTSTKIVIGFSDTVATHGGKLLIAIIIFIILYIWARRTPRTKYYLNMMDLNLPMLKGVFIQLHLAFFMRYLSMLITAGMDILRGLELATESVGNLVIRRYLVQSRERVIEGELFSESLRGIRYIPNMITRMISIGEESGTLPDQMEYVADYYNEELERKIATALAMMEPILLFIMGGLALFLVMSVMLPIYNLVGSISQGVGAGAGAGM